MRDHTLTMSNLQNLAVPIGANLAATDSSVAVPEPLAGHPEPSGEMSLQDMVWIVEFRETGTAQMEGTLNAELQVSVDNGATWRTGDGIEIPNRRPGPALRRLRCADPRRGQPAARRAGDHQRRADPLQDGLHVNRTGWRRRRGHRGRDELPDPRRGRVGPARAIP